MNKKTKTSIVALLVVVLGLFLGNKKLLTQGINMFSENNTVTEQSNITDGNNERIYLKECIDGDTARFSSIGKTRFLLVDTPESNNKVEPYGKAASKFTCDKLKAASVITYSLDGPRKDKYDRTLAYIFVDGELLQELIAKEGYVKQLYKSKKIGEYKYEKQILTNLNDKYSIYKGINWIK